MDRLGRCDDRAPPGPGRDGPATWTSSSLSTAQRASMPSSRPASARRMRLERYEREGFVRRAGDASPTDLARLAVDELGADWLIPGRPDELWWPRGENLKDVLAVIPPRYGVVQALVRTFVGESGEQDGRSAFESRTVRTSLLGPDGSGGEPLQRLLRPRLSSGAEHDAHAADWTLGGRRVPLRAWYPIEVFRYPVQGAAPEREQTGRRSRRRARSSSTSERDDCTHGSPAGSSFPVPTSSTTPRTRSNAQQWRGRPASARPSDLAISSRGSPSWRRASGRGCCAR